MIPFSRPASSPRLLPPGSPGALCLEVQGFQRQLAWGPGRGLSPEQSGGHSAPVWLLQRRVEGRRGGASAPPGTDPLLQNLFITRKTLILLWKTSLERNTNYFSQSDFYITDLLFGFPGSSNGEPACQCRRH